MEAESSGLIAEQHSWAQLPNDVLSIIFTKVGAVHVLLSAQQVCHSWHQVALDPSALFWRCIDMSVLQDEDFGHIKCDNLAKLAFDRSGGNVEKFFALAVSEDFLTYITDRTPRLRCFGLILCMNEHPKVLFDFFSRCPLLEELHIYFCFFYYKQYQSIALGCPGLKRFYVDRMNTNHHPPTESDDEYNSFTNPRFVTYHEGERDSYHVCERDSDSDSDLNSISDFELEFCPEGQSRTCNSGPNACNSGPNDDMIAQMTTKNTSTVASIPSSNTDHGLYQQEGPDSSIQNETVPGCLYLSIDQMVLEIAKNMPSITSMSSSKSDLDLCQKEEAGLIIENDLDNWLEQEDLMALEIAKNMSSIASISSSNTDLELYQEEVADLNIENELDPDNWLDQDDLIAPEIANKMSSIASISSSNSDLELYQEEETNLIIEGLDSGNLINLDDLMALEIANNMLQLRELHLLRNYWLTNMGVHTILDKCLHLEFLNIRCCFKVRVDEALQSKLCKIKAVKLSRHSQFHLHND